MKKLLFLIGTRPEAIKLAPLIRLVKKETSFFQPIICLSGQHMDLVQPVVRLFGIKPDYQLDLMEDDQSINLLASRLLEAFDPVLKKEKPELVIVQGDTTTAFVGALAGFYQKIPVAHIEAGLRTYQKSSPFPEEMNRTLITKMADYHFAPTRLAEEQLIKEGIAPEAICNSGNTGIDALFQGIALANNQGKHIQSQIQQHLEYNLQEETPLILVTIHRRENFGDRLKTICNAIRQFAKKDAHQIILPIHPNPKINQIVYQRLRTIKNVHLIPPLVYDQFLWLMQQVDGILTDSGGIQEEAVTLGIPTIVLRDFTERTEGLSSGILTLCPVSEAPILDALEQLPAQHYPPQTTFGDGKASHRIISFLKEQL